jgi:hypothetical protein
MCRGTGRSICGEASPSSTAQPCRLGMLLEASERQRGLRTDIRVTMAYETAASAFPS